MWTIRRTPNMWAGCHFYIAGYGIRIQQASNTLIAWQPGDEHGSSLPDCDPSEISPKFCQQGVAFVTSNRLESAWVKLCDGSFTRQQATDFAVKDDESHIKYTQK